MKCTDCVYHGDSIKHAWCNPDDKDDKEDSCNDFSVQCQICNAGIVETNGECCEDLQLAREEENNPCPKKPNRSICNQGTLCPGCFTAKELDDES